MDHQRTGKRAALGLLRGVAAVVALGVCVWVLALPSGVAARIVVDHEDLENQLPGQVFSALATAWSAGDLRTLADLVQTQGVTVNTGGGHERDTHYSPSQAYYYFKNLFQSRTTVSFHFDKTEDATRGDRAHGLAIWEFRTGAGREAEAMKLVLVLARDDGQWRLSEINTIR